jgi:hypothetical protein
MTKREAQLVLVIAGLVLVASAVFADDGVTGNGPIYGGVLPVPDGSVTLGPVEPVTGPGSANPGSTPLDAADVQMCRCSPLNSFAPRCEGITWGNLPFLGRTDFRNQRPPDCY